MKENGKDTEKERARQTRGSRTLPLAVGARNTTGPSTLQPRRSIGAQPAQKGSAALEHELPTLVPPLQSRDCRTEVLASRPGAGTGGIASIMPTFQRLPAYAVGTVYAGGEMQ